MSHSKKKSFDYEVQKEYANALEKAKSKGEISALGKIALKQSTESMVIAKWRMREARNQRIAAKTESDEKLRLLKESLAKEMESE